MRRRMTYEEIEERFAGEWVVVRDFIRDDTAIIKEGIVVTHTPDHAAARDRRAVSGSRCLRSPSPGRCASAAALI
jgi:hypothetical protein